MAFQSVGPLWGHGPATNAPYSLAPAGVITLRPRGEKKSRLATVLREHQKVAGPMGLSRTGPVGYWKGWDFAGRGLSGLGLTKPLLQPIEVLEPTDRSLLASKRAYGLAGSYSYQGRGLGQLPLGLTLPTLLALGVGGFLLWRFVFKPSKKEALRKARLRAKARAAKIKAEYA